MVVRHKKAPRVSQGQIIIHEKKKPLFVVTNTPSKKLAAHFEKRMIRAESPKLIQDEAAPNHIDRKQELAAEEQKGSLQFDC